MKIVLMFSSLLLTCVLSARAVHTREGSIVVDPDLITILIITQIAMATFASPGQAKKGRCRFAVADFIPSSFKPSKRRLFNSWQKN